MSHSPIPFAPEANSAIIPASGAGNAAPASPTLGKRIAMALALIAVPAMAAPGDFGALPGAAPSEGGTFGAELARQLADNPPMPFEQPGMSFPGSAFFFLDEPEQGTLTALPSVDPAATGADIGLAPGQAIDPGPAPRPFFAAGGIAHERALECLARAVWYEAAGESESGQRAVAQVVLNRVAHTSWPNSVCGVVNQGAHRAQGCQFSFNCDGSLARRASGPSWTRAQRIAGDALSGHVYAPIGHATHYHTLWVSPYWAASLDRVGTIGAHIFYRTRGQAGESAAFTGSYAGVEPAVSVRRASVQAPARAPMIAPELSALDIEPAAAGGGASVTAPPPPPGPLLANPSLSGVGQVREDYARAGRWKDPEARAAHSEASDALAREAANPRSRR